MERNDPCWCGSGKKYKKCHMPIEEKIKLHRDRGEIVPSRKLLKTPAQIEKIKNYKTHDIRLGENLVITSSHKHFQAPRILWQLVIRRVLSAAKARKLIKKIKK